MFLEIAAIGGALCFVGFIWYGIVLDETIVDYDLDRIKSREEINRLSKARRDAETRYQNRL